MNKRNYQDAFIFVHAVIATKNQYQLDLETLIMYNCEVVYKIMGNKTRVDGVSILICESKIYLINLHKQNWFKANYICILYHSLAVK